MNASTYETEHIRAKLVDKVWEVENKKDDNQKVTFTIGDDGVISFDPRVNGFPYGEALSIIVREEKRKLCVMCKAGGKTDRIMKHAFAFKAVPVMGIKLRMYYSQY